MRIKLLLYTLSGCFLTFLFFYFQSKEINKNEKSFKGISSDKEKPISKAKNQISSYENPISHGTIKKESGNKELNHEDFQIKEAQLSLDELNTSGKNKDSLNEKTNSQDKDEFPEMREYWNHRGPPFLKTFVELKNKALFTAEEKKDYKETISSLKIIEASATLLIKEPLEHKLNPLRKKDRMLSVLFLKRALNEVNNPAEDKVTESIVDILMTNNLSNRQTMALRKSLAQDKYVLMKALYDKDPKLAKEVHQSVTDGVLDRIYNFAIYGKIK